MGHELVRVARRARRAFVALVVGAFLAMAATPAFAATTTTTSVAQTSTTTSTAAPPGGVHAQIFYPSLTVTPSTGLRTGQQVTLTGRGPATTASECTVQGLCDDSTAVSITPGTAGTFSAHMVVRRFLHLGGSTVDCAVPARCRIQTRQFGTAPALIEAWAVIGFSSAAAPPVVVSVTPAAHLVDLQAVQVHASGFLPGALVTVDECASGDVLCTDVNAPSGLQADARGRVTATGFMHRTITGFGTSYDCATGSCTVRVASFDGDAGSAPVTFDAAPPLRPPIAVTVTPDGNLTGSQPVALHAVGFAAGDTVTVEECTVVTPSHLGPFCETLATPTVPASGTADLTVAVTDAVPTIVPDVPQACGTDQCEIVVTSHASPSEAAHVPIAFGGPVAPSPAAPTMAVTPDVDLADRQAVTVSGDHLDPAVLGDLPSLTECALGVGRFACSPGPVDALLLPDATGHYSATFYVSRIVAGLDGTHYDCADAPGRCALTFDGGPPLVPLAFDPSIPPAAAPLAQLSPAGLLADRAMATVHATGFVPGSTVSATECSTLACDFGEQVVGTADPSGAVTFDLQVFRFFDDFVAGRIDCTAGCSIRLDDRTANGVTLPLVFDPRLPMAAPHPAISVARADALVGGGDSVVSGVGFGPFSVTVGECPAGATNLDRCDALDVATTDGSGGFTITTGTKAVLDTPGGPVDCRRGFGTCVYAAWDGHDLFTAPIGFVAGSPTGVLGVTTTPAAPPPGSPATTTPGSGDGPGGGGVDVRGASLAAPAASGSSETLPFTGSAPGRVLEAGIALVLAGVVALRASRPRRAR